MSEQSVARLRRRGDAGSFAAACEVAIRIATRRLRSIAFERAVEGTIKRHYYHGELKAEERVYDNRLLRYLLEKTGLLCDPGNHVATAEKRWPALLDSIELGGSPDGAAATAREDVWEEDGRLWTGFPPPPGFRGTEDGMFGDALYRRSLTKPERAALVAQDEKDSDRSRVLASLRRDRFFGFAAAGSTG